MRLAEAAYEEYQRIHAESGIKLPPWEEIGLTARMGWEAAAARFRGFDGRFLPDDQVITRPEPPHRAPGTTYNR